MLKRRIMGEEGTQHLLPRVHPVRLVCEVVTLRVNVLAAVVGILERVLVIVGDLLRETVSVPLLVA